MTLGESGFQDPLYGCVQDSSELFQCAGHVDLKNQTQTFGKAGFLSILWIFHRFTNQGKLKQMFEIEGKFENPLRSGWQLVFVDRENDVLLLRDYLWEKALVSITLEFYLMNLFCD